MMKLSKMTDYAVIVLAEMAKQKGAVMSAAALSVQTKLPEPTVSKVLKLLAREDIVTSIRGANGGYKLEKQPENVSIACIINATDGPIALTSCVVQDNDCCDRTTICSMKGKWSPVNNAMQQAMESITLKQMMGQS